MTGSEHRRDALGAVAASSRDPRIGHDAGLRFLHWSGGDCHAAPIVLLHGMGDGADVWRATVEALQDTFSGDILAFELPGHWGSDWREDGQYTLTETADRLCRVIARQVAGPVHLVGHSLGARIGAYIAARETPIALETLVLIDMNPDPGEDGLHAVHEHIDALNHGPFGGTILSAIAISRLPFCVPDAVKKYLHAAVESLPEQAKHSVDPSVLDFDVTEAGLPVDCWTLLAEIRCPVAILRGAFSSILPAPVAHRAAMSLRSCLGFFVISNAGHAIPLEQPSALARLIQQCSQSTGAGRSAAW